MLSSERADGSELIEPFFGVSVEQSSRFSEEHFGDGSPARPSASITVPFPNGFSLSVEFDTDEERYVLREAGRPPDVLLGCYSGNFVLPAFRWREIVQIDDHLSASASADPRHRRSALLLLFPGVYLTPDDDPDEVRRPWCDDGRPWVSSATAGSVNWSITWSKSGQSRSAGGETRCSAGSMTGRATGIPIDHGAGLIPRDSAASPRFLERDRDR